MWERIKQFFGSLLREQTLPARSQRVESIEQDGRCPTAVSNIGTLRPLNAPAETGILSQEANGCCSGVGHDHLMNETANTNIT